MKRLTFKLLLVILALLVSTTAFTQQYRTVEKSVQMDKQSVNAWVMLVGNEPLDVLKEDFVRYARKQLKVKAKKEGRDMLIARAAKIPTISALQGDLRARFFTENKENMLALAFMPGYDIALSSADNRTEMANLRKFVEEFVKQYKIGQYQEQLSVLASRKKNVERNYKKDKREQRKLNKSLKKIDKQLASDKSEGPKKYALNNQKIAKQSRIEALDKIMINQKGELMKLDQEMQSIEASIKHLENMFSASVNY